MRPMKGRRVLEKRKEEEVVQGKDTVEQEDEEEEEEAGEKVRVSEWQLMQRKGAKGEL